MICQSSNNQSLSITQLEIVSMFLKSITRDPTFRAKEGLGMLEHHNSFRNSRVCNSTNVYVHISSRQTSLELKYILPSIWFKLLIYSLISFTTSSVGANIAQSFRYSVSQAPTQNIGNVFLIIASIRSPWGFNKLSFEISISACPSFSTPS